MLGNLVVLSRKTNMKTSPKSPKIPKKGVPVTIMVAIGKPKKAMPMRGSRTATNMMKKSSRGK